MLADSNRLQAEVPGAASLRGQAAAGSAVPVLHGGPSLGLRPDYDWLWD